MSTDTKIPAHVAIIMDGNGRWAQARGLDRKEGHAVGAEAVRRTVRACAELGVRHLTLYSFSTENWSRPEGEVDSLMALLARYLVDTLEELQDNDVRLRAIGQLDRLPRHVAQLLAAAEEATAGNQGLTLTLALSYGARAELVDACRVLARDVSSGQLAPDDIDEAAIEARLYTAGTPSPDLLIRTSGEMRLSNFLLWQLAYTELYVTDVMWPDFDREALTEAFRDYALRHRRYGKTASQVAVT